MRVRSPYLVRLGGLAVLALVLASGCGPEPGGPGEAGGPGSPKPWNVLLVTFDTTRADHLGCYGNQRIETPILDGLAAEGIRFSRALAAVPITAPSHASIHTGRYPMAHGVRDNGLFVLGSEQKTLAEILREHGYATAAAIGAYPLLARFGLDQGFDLYDDHLTGRFEDYLGRRVVQKEHLFFDERRAAQVNEAIFPWLEEHGESPFFAWVHYFDPHQPFEPPPPYDQLYADDPYSGEIAYGDASLGLLLKKLEELQVLDRTLIVMTADHGEGLSEHNELTHAILAYNSTLHVPLILRPPDGTVPAGRVIDDWVTTVEVAPTILDLLGIEAPEEFQGRSLRRLWEARPGEGHRRSVRYAENLSPRLTHGWGEFRVLFDDNLKYIHGPRPELFDLDADPHELTNLLPEQPEEGERLRRTLEEFLRRYSVAGASKAEAMDDEVRQRLQSLGYLHSGGGGSEVFAEELRSDGAAPQDRVGLLNDLSAVKQLLFKGDAARALIYSRRLMAVDDQNPLFLELHASALAAVGKIDEAWAVAQILDRDGSVPEPLLVQISLKRFSEGDRSSTVSTFERLLGDQPGAVGLWTLATMKKSLGDRRGAEEVLRRLLEDTPTFAPAVVDLAILHAEDGDGSAAEERFVEALAIAPFYPKAPFNYGTFLLHQGRVSEAIPFFQRAISLWSGYLDARMALMVALLEDGQSREAEAAYAALRDLAPQSLETQRAAELLASSRSE